MTDKILNQVFLSYNESDRALVEALARRLKGDARLAFWFAPWHSIPGQPIQEQMEEALQRAQACAVFIGANPLAGWPNEQMRTAIQTRVEDNARYRVIPVFLPGPTHLHREAMPAFLRRYAPVEFSSLDDEQAFSYLLAGILGIRPSDVEGFVQAAADKEKAATPPTAGFIQGHALMIGIAHYHPPLRALPDSVLNDARDMAKLLADPVQCGYPASHITTLLDDEATGDGIRQALAALSKRTQAGDTAVVFFSGHGARHTTHDSTQQYLVPYDCTPDDLAGTAITGDQMSAMLSAIRAARLLAIFDCCHSGGAGDPKTLLPAIELGFSDDYYQALAQGSGRVVIASCRSEELSWTLYDMNNSLFTHYLLEALRGQAKTLGDGRIHVFDIFRHVAEHVPVRAAQVQQNQHPIFKASMLEQDFAIALAPI